MSQYLFPFFIAFMIVMTLSVHVPCQNDKTNHWKQQRSLILTERQQITNSMYNVDVMVDAQDQMVSESIVDQGAFQPKSVRAFMQLVKEGQQVMNVGSHIGLEAVTIGQAIGKTGHLYIFQPYQVSYSLALKNVYLNELQDFTTVINKGCGNKKTVATIKVAKDNTGGTGVTVGGNTQSDGNNRVNVDTLDNMMPDVPVDLMLMDVQRSEVVCLEGMKRVIKNSPNIMMYVEWGGDSDTYKEAKDLLIWLQQQEGFRFYYHDPINRGDCDRILYTQYPLQVIMGNRQKGIQMDVLMARKHIDPNSFS